MNGISSLCHLLAILYGDGPAIASIVEGGWFYWIPVYCTYAMLMWLHVTLFKLSKIAIFMSPDTDSEAKIRSQLKFLHILTVVYCFLTIGYWGGEIIYISFNLSSSASKEQASIMRLCAVSFCEIIWCLASIYIFVVGRRLIFVFNKHGY